MFAVFAQIDTRCELFFSRFLTYTVFVSETTDFVESQAFFQTFKILNEPCAIT